MKFHLGDASYDCDWSTEEKTSHSVQFVGTKETQFIYVFVIEWRFSHKQSDWQRLRKAKFHLDLSLTELTLISNSWSDILPATFVIVTSEGDFLTYLSGI